MDEDGMISFHESEKDRGDLETCRYLADRGGLHPGAVIGKNENG